MGAWPLAAAAGRAVDMSRRQQPIGGGLAVLGAAAVPRGPSRLAAFGMLGTAVAAGRLLAAGRQTLTSAPAAG
jgi:hypothetical protein